MSTALRGASRAAAAPGCARARGAEPRTVSPHGLEASATSSESAGDTGSSVTAVMALASEVDDWGSPARPGGDGRPG
jgi:hypothetical protein